MAGIRSGCGRGEDAGAAQEPAAVPWPELRRSWRNRDLDHLKTKEIHGEVEKLTANSPMPFLRPEKARKGVGHARY